MVFILIGKVVLEKVLRTFSNVKNVYISIKTKVSKVLVFKYFWMV